MKQRPLKTILKRKPLPKVEPPAKPEPKITSNDTKTVKGPIKSIVPEYTPVGPPRKPEIKKTEEEKRVVPAPAPVEPLQGGHYELNSRMTKMVENELRDIMIKVWHELPDNPTNDAEALVVDKLRNKAGDDFRNVLGLNITKRLLNVHNPLYVKVQFSGKPEKAHLAEFLKKYNFTAFKRIEKTVNMFAAQVRTINDFDRISSEKEIKCGDIKVLVNPIYKFTKCPPNLITSFVDKDEDTSDGTAELNEKDDKQEIKPKQTKTPEKAVAKPTENVQQIPKAEPSKVENKTSVQNKTVNKPIVENKTIIDNKTAVTKSTVENKTADPKTDEQPAVNKPVANKPVEGKTMVNKPSVENKAAAKPATVTKNVTKSPIDKKEVKKPQSNDIAKKSVPSPIKPQTKKAHKSESDYDELDDHDILALMSEGIVLDECSGSDDE